MSVAAGMSRRRFSSVDGRSPKPACCHSQSAREKHRQPQQQHQESGDDAFFQREGFEHARQFRILRQQPSAMANTLVKNANATS